MMRPDLIIEHDMPGHVKSINISYQSAAKAAGKGLWFGAIFYHGEGAKPSTHEADTLGELLRKIDDEVFEDMPEHDPDPEAA